MRTVVVGLAVLALALGGVLRAAQSEVVDSSRVAIEERERDVRYAVLNDGVGVCVSLSGGGLRAAAFHAGVLYGVHEALRSIDPTGDGIDVVSGISGGAITAALYSLYPGEAWSSEGVTRLKAFIGSDPVKTTTTGILVWLGFRDRILTFQKVLDEGLYEHRSFDDMPTRNRPYLIVGATDLRTGKLVLFTKVTLWHHRKFPFSRAVAASSAIPAVFNSLELKPARITADVAGEQDQLDEEGPVPLNDGGIRDNLGLWPLLDRAVERTVNSRPERIQPLCHLIIASDASLRAKRVDRSALFGVIAPALRSIDVLMELVSSGTEAVASDKKSGEPKVLYIPVRMPDGFREIGTASDLSDGETKDLIDSGFSLAHDTLESKSASVKAAISRARTPARGNSRGRETRPCRSSIELLFGAFELQYRRSHGLGTAGAAPERGRALRGIGGPMD